MTPDLWLHASFTVSEEDLRNDGGIMTHDLYFEPLRADEELITVEYVEHRVV